MSAEDSAVFEGVEKVTLDGGSAELVSSDALAKATAAIDEAQASKASHDAMARVLRLDGYDGKLELASGSHFEVTVNGATVNGSLGNGRLIAPQIDVSCVAAKPAVTPKPPAVPKPFLVELVKDVFGVLLFTLFYFAVFALFTRDKALDYWSLQTVLGAGTYHGYSGRMSVSTFLALCATCITILFREGDAEIQTSDFAKLGVFLVIMIVGRLLRDYVDSFKRDGWRGLKNRLGR